MQTENVAYALTQVVHNFGAVAVAGGAAFALWASPMAAGSQGRLARLVSFGWAMQLTTGAGFAAASYYYYGRLPDIHAVALAALYVKIACAAGGLVIALRLQSRAERWNEARCKLAWRALAALGATALAAAAFLRWFS